MGWGIGLEIKRNPDGTLVLTGIALAIAVAALVRGKPVLAAPDEKLDYLVEAHTLMLQQLQKLVEIGEQLLAISGVPPVEVTVKTPWVAKEPEEIFREYITSADTFYSKMVDWTQGKRFMIKVESSLDKAVQIQVIGDIIDSVIKATDIGPVFSCPAKRNISIGLAFDDWQPFIGVKITTVEAPTGILTISAVIQE